VLEVIIIIIIIRRRRIRRRKILCKNNSLPRRKVGRGSLNRKRANNSHTKLIKAHRKGLLFGSGFKGARQSN
jgi:hypothetical protein